MATCKHKLIVRDTDMVVACDRDIPHMGVKHHFGEEGWDIIWPDSYSATPEQLKELEMAKAKSAQKNCGTCKEEIKMIAYVGTGFCSQNCKDAASSDPTINHSAGVSPHRSVAAAPRRQGRASTFTASR